VRPHIRLFINAPLLALLASVLAFGSAHALPGNVLSSQKISDTQGNFTPIIDNGDEVGGAVAYLGDLDGAGPSVGAVAIGTTFDDDGPGLDRGAVYIAFLAANGTVTSSVKISDTVNFPGTPLDDGDWFGSSIAYLGDLDGTGPSVAAIAVGAIGDDDGAVGALNTGAVYILFLNASGTVLTVQKISNANLPGAPLASLDEFGTSIASLGDLDGAGASVQAITVGTPGKDDGGTDLGAAYTLFLSTAGTVLSVQKISDTTNFPGAPLDAGDMFGGGVANLGDLDGTGPSVRAVAIGSEFDDDGGPDRGAVYILFLNAAGTVLSVQKLSNLVGNFTDPLLDFDEFGNAVENLGDIDGPAGGVTALAVGVAASDDGGLDRGAIEILFLNSNGTCNSSRKISSTTGGFAGPLVNEDAFGSGLAFLGDLDGGGASTLALASGTPGSDDGGTDRGAVHVLFLDGVPTRTLTVNVVGSGTVSKSPDLAAYPSGSVVQLTATPAAGWLFSGWSGALTGSTNPASLTVDANKTVTATFVQARTLTVNVVGMGTVTKNPNLTSYPNGSVVQLTATPAAGWLFSGWSGALTGSTNPANLTMDANKTVTATFVQARTLTVNTVGSGTVTKNPNLTSYPDGSSVQLTAVPAAGWLFSGWSGDLTGSTNPANLTMNANKTVTATFVLARTLTVNTVGSGTVTKSPNLTSYPDGSSVQLTAVPAAGWLFSGWSGDLTGSTNPASLTMNANKTVTATFVLARTLTVNTVGSGTVTKSPNLTSYPDGSSVQLTAVPAAGWLFSGWSGDLTGSTNPTNLTMNANKTVTATFVQARTLTVTVVGSGTVAKSPDLTSYPNGSSVQLTATPAAGWLFSGWSGDLTGSTNPANLTMNANKAVTATFVQARTLTVNVVGSGTVSKSPDLTAYPNGSSVQLTATPAAGWLFSGWSGALTGSTNPATLTMDANKTVTATFVQARTLTVTVVGSGTVAKSPNLSTYPNGSSVQLTATPDPGWVFSGWSGALTGSTNPATLTMDADKAVTATFVQARTLTVTVVGSGTVAKSPNLATYPNGSSVQLTATPDPGWIFSGWSGALTGSTNPATLTMDADKAVTATFVQARSLTVNVVGSGTVAKSPDLATYPNGSSVQLTATPDPGWVFSGWSGDLTGSSNPANLTMDADKTVTATFVQMRSLTVNVVGSGTVAKSPDLTSYPNGSSVQLTATPDPGWVFSGWSGDLTGSTNPATLTMDADKTVTATFVQARTLTVNVVGSGTVAKSPNLATYPNGSSVQLTATPDPGWIFSGWSGDLTGSTNPANLTMDADKTVTATFVQARSLTVNVVGTGAVTKSPNLATYPNGSSVQLTATPGPGLAFSGWSGDLTGSTNPANLTMDADKTVTATFVQARSLTVTMVGKGTVTKSPDLAAYPDGSSVQLTANPGPGWSFSGWSGDLTGVTNPATLTMDTNKTVTPTFLDITPPAVTLTSPNGGEVLADGLHFKIKWTATDNDSVARIDLDLSRTGVAGPYQSIKTNASRSGIFDWVVTLPITTHALIRITVRDLAGNTTQDLSNAEFAIAGGVGTEGGSVTAFALSPLWPNPVRTQARFELALPHEAHVRLGVYDLQGRERLVLADDLFPAGRHTVDGASIVSSGLDPGLYFLRMSVPGTSFVRRFLLMH